MFDLLVVFVLMAVAIGACALTVYCLREESAVLPRRLPRRVPADVPRFDTAQRHARES